MLRDSKVAMAETQDKNQESTHENPDTQEWRPYDDSWLEVPLWGSVFIKWPSACYERFPQRFFGLRWFLLSPFRIRIGMPQLGEWSLGEVIIFLGIILVTAAAGLITFGTEESSGSVAAIPIALVFMLATRNSVWTLVLGLPFERAIFWHQLLAYMGVALGVTHGISAGMNMSGLVFEIAMGALCVLAFGPIRRKFWELFLRTHWILFIIAAIAGIAHEASGIGVGIFLWVIDLVTRYLIMAGCRYPKQAKIERLPADVIKLSFPKGNFQYKGGQYIFICVPELTVFEWHPFSLSSAPYQDEVSIHIRVLGDWTKRLYELASKKDMQQIKVLMEGPFGAPAVDLDGNKYKHVLLLSGGIGITPMQSICNDLMYQLEQGRPLEKVWFVWSVRDKFMVDAVLKFDESKTQGARLPHSFSPDLIKEFGSSSKSISSAEAPTEQPNLEGLGEGPLITDFYLTKARADDQHSFGNIKPDLMPFLNFGRPDLKTIFEQKGMIAKSSRQKGSKLVVCNYTEKSLHNEHSSLSFTIQVEVHSL